LFPIQGATIIKQGEVGDFYYIIDEGHCEIFVASVGKVLDVKEGDTFGELALMYDAPRAATVIAASNVVTWALDQTTFKKTLKDSTIKKRSMLQDFLKDVPILKLLTGTSFQSTSFLFDAMVPSLCLSTYF
jgi:cAMP-dependent protein kinase regulator